jgi:hypothetical protein
MPRVQINTGCSTETRRQVDELTEKYNYTIREVVTLAIDMFYRSKYKCGKPKKVEVSDS